MGQELTDRECAELSQRGDHAAYSVLVRRYQDRIYRFLLRMVGSRDEALDLAQDVLIKAFQALPGWRPEAQFRTWLFRIASNAATDALRRRKVVEFVALDEDYDVPGESAGPEAQLAARQQLRALDAAATRRLTRSNSHENIETFRSVVRHRPCARRAADDS